MFRCCVFRPVNDAQILPTSTFDRWLHQTTSILRHEVDRLYNGSFTSTVLSTT
jgi:hypothetical protein